MTPPAINLALLATPTVEAMLAELEAHPHRDDPLLRRSFTLSIRALRDDLRDRDDATV